MNAERKSIKMPYKVIIVHGFRTEYEKFDSGKKCFIRKGISRGVEWHKFQLRSTFQ